MKVAALYDIHGNLPALRAVLAEVAAVNPTMLVIGGDVVAGPLPEETLDELFGAGYIMRWVMGNTDRELDPWVAGRLRPEQEILVDTFQPSVATGGALFCHGSPRSDTEFLTPFTPDERIDAACDGVRQRVVICGHSHRQFDRVAAGRRIVNAGSIGWPFEGDADARWLLLDDGEPVLKRTAYDVDAALTELARSQMPDFTAFVAGSLVDPGDPDVRSRAVEALAT